jgi:RND family efflux transporter MFP subunit
VKLPPINPRRAAAIYSTARWAATLIIAFVLLFLAYYVYADVINRAPADVWVVQRGKAVSAVYGTVTVSSTLSLNLNAQNSGFLRMAPGFGTMITSQGIILKKDELLATVVDEVGSRALAQAHTDYEAALARQKLGPGNAAALKSAEDQLAAYDKLPNPNMVPAVTRQAARNQVESLKAAVDNEKLELQRQVDTTAGVVKTAEEQLKRTEIRSPMDGILTAMFYNDNSYVLATQPLFTVASPILYISGQVNEEDVGKLKPGMKAEMHLYAYGSTTFSATVTAVLPSPDPNSSRYTVTLNMDNPPDNLLLGLTGEMNIILGRKENALVIPARALMVDQVLVVKHGVIEQRSVEIGFKSLEYAEITKGLREGDAVVVQDQDAFRSGERVRAVRVNEKTTPAKVASATK